MSTKSYAVIILFLAATIVGLIAGDLWAASGTELASCIVYGGGAFATTVVVGAAVWGMLK